jgi:Xaa-Pro aminopeptidase
MTNDKAWFLCDSRYTEQAAEEVVNAEVMECGAVRSETVVSLANEYKLSRIGFEAAHTTVSAYRGMSEKLSGIDLVELGSNLDEIRICKDAVEIEILKSVARLSSASLAAVLGSIRPGVREVDLAMALELEMISRGADGKALILS